MTNYTNGRQIDRMLWIRYLLSLNGSFRSALESFQCGAPSEIRGVITLLGGILPKTPLILRVVCCDSLERQNPRQVELVISIIPSCGLHSPRTDRIDKSNSLCSPCQNMP